MSVKNWRKPGSLPLLALFVYFALLLTIVFDFSVARPIIGFVFLTFMPGFVIVRQLKLRLEKLETVLFSIGLSLAFWMIATFFMNLILPYVGFVAPLSLLPLLVLSSGIVIMFVILEWQTSLNFDLAAPFFRIALSGILLVLPIILTLVGVFLVRAPPYTNNSILLIMLVTISVLVGLTLFAKKLFPPEVYPLLLFVIAFCLMMHILLFSNYLQGGDIFGEYSVFKTTALSGHWDLALVNRLSAMLSVTTLPTAYYNILNLDPVWVFKIVYPLIFAFVPLGVYQLYKSKMSVEVSLQELI